ncbi:hypothetical protein ACFFRR_000749 [Megaselia abdita]
MTTINTTEQLRELLSQETLIHNADSHSQDYDNLDFDTDQFLNQPTSDQNKKMALENGANNIQSPEQSSSTHGSQYDNTYFIVPDNYDDAIDTDLLNTLNCINAENAGFLYQYFVNFNVRHHQIKYLKGSHIEKIIPDNQIGIMAEFQHKLELWKSSEETAIDVVHEQNLFRNSKASILEIISPNPKLQAKVQKTDLNDKEAKTLLTMVRDYFVNQCGNRMSAAEMERISNEIEKYFPGEESQTYFKRSIIKQKDGTLKTKITGQLVSKWFNRTDKESSKKKKLLEDGTAQESATVKINIIENEDEQKRVQAALKNSSKKPFDMILRDWNICRDIRLKCLLENKNNPLTVLAEWPTYNWPEGNILMADDFRYLFPEVKNDLHIKWNKFCDDILPIYEEVKDRENQELLPFLRKPNLSLDAKSAITLHLLPTILKPTGRPQLPVLTAQESLATFVTDIRKLVIENKQQPRVIVVFEFMTGKKAFEKVLQIVFYMEGNYYIVNTVLEAIEHMFMAHFVFFIDFNKAAHNCMHFIMKYFFNMQYVGEKCSPATTKLLKRLRN